LLFVCGIDLHQDHMSDLVERVFLLMIEAETQDARLARAMSPQRTERPRERSRRFRRRLTVYIGDRTVREGPYISPRVSARAQVGDGFPYPRRAEVVR
jgi:hypothetical protein